LRAFSCLVDVPAGLVDHGDPDVGVAAQLAGEQVGDDGAADPAAEDEDALHRVFSTTISS
jgi:hypothetical protein